LEELLRLQRFQRFGRTSDQSKMTDDEFYVNLNKVPETFTYLHFQY
jgi:hypothetical protein